MKRAPLEPTKENLLTTLEQNILGRNEDIRSLIRIIDGLESNYTIALDSAWGNGKTFLVKQLELVLDYYWAKTNEYEMGARQKIKTLITETKKDEWEDSQPASAILPVYFNAWQYDNHQDPLTSILYSIISSKPNFKNFVKESKSLITKVAAIADVINPFSSGSLTNAAEVFSKRNLLEQTYDIEKVNEVIRLLFNKLLCGTDDDENEPNRKILLIVDELDRCRPTYAIEVLERIKHFFDLDNLVILFAVNKEQLVHSISHVYGQNMDASRYLNRFFDNEFSLHLDNDRRNKFLSLLGMNSTSEIVDFMVQILQQHYSLPLRETSIFYAKMRSVVDKLNYEVNNPMHRMMNNDTHLFLYYVFVPLVIILPFVDNKKSQLFESGQGFAEIVKILNSSDKLYSYISKSLSGHILFKETDTLETKRNQILGYFENLYTLIFDETLSQGKRNDLLIKTHLTSEYPFNKISILNLSRGY